MTTPPMILWQEAGEPEEYVDGLQSVDGGTRCATCGAHIDRAMPIGEAWTNEDAWEHFHDASSQWVCTGCAFASKGRWKDQFRLWTLLYCEDGGLPDHHPTVYEHIDEATYPVRLEPVVEHADDRIQITNRGDVSGLLDLLLDPPDCRWWAAIADSAQKKITRLAPMTAGDPYEVLFEYQTVSTSSDEMTELLWHVASLRKLGVSEDRIRSGHLSPTYDAKSPMHARRVHIHNEWLDGVRGHPRFELALFLCTQETTDGIGQRTGRTLERHRTERSGQRLTPGRLAERLDGRDRPKRLVGQSGVRTEGGGGHGDELPADVQQDGGQASGQSADQEDEPGGQIDLFDAL